MLPIQFILCGALLFLVFTYLVRLKSYKIDRIIIILIFLIGILFIIFPDMTMKIANFLGVGRGADLLLYFCVVGFAFSIIILYSKQRKFEDLLVAILRKDALQNARQPFKGDPCSSAKKIKGDGKN